MKSGKRIAILRFILAAVAAASLLGRSWSRAEDWPQLGRTPQRWNSAPEKIRLPVKQRWCTSLVDIDLRHRVYHAVQVIVGGGRAYVGTKSGVLFALDAQDGKVCWQFRAAGPILHTAGFSAGKVFVGAMDGCVYAIETATGEPAWTFRSGRRYGFSTAVLLADDRVFVADRGGMLFALAQADGKKVWQYDAQSPLLQSAAYNGGQIYFADEGLRMHAVRAADGTRAWRSERLAAFRFLPYWPVVAHGKVFVQGGAGVSDPLSNPMLIFEEKTGRQVECPAPLSHGFSMHGPHAPPAVIGTQLVVPATVAKGFGRYGWALFDLPAEQLTKLLPADKQEMESGKDVGVGAPDEVMIASVVGGAVFVVHHHGFTGNPGSQSGAYDLLRRQWFACPPTPWSPGDSGYVENNTQGGGACAVSAANGLCYHQAFHRIVCYEPAKQLPQPSERK